MENELKATHEQTERKLKPLPVTGSSKANHEGMIGSYWLRPTKSSLRRLVRQITEECSDLGKSPLQIRQPYV